MSSEPHKSFSTAYQSIEGVGYNLHEATTKNTGAPKTFFGNKIDARLLKTLKTYAANNNYQMSFVLEQALSEYFVNHRSEFPTTNLTIAVEQEPRLRKAEKDDSKSTQSDVKDTEKEHCQIGECEGDITDIMIYRCKGQPDKKFKVCQKHATAYSRIDNWRFKP